MLADHRRVLWALALGLRCCGLRCRSLGALAAPFVYVANDGSGNVSQDDASSGALSPPTSAAGIFPESVAVSPAAVVAGTEPFAVAVNGECEEVDPARPGVSRLWGVWVRDCGLESPER